MIYPILKMVRNWAHAELQKPGQNPDYREALRALKRALNGVRGFV